MNAPFHCGVDIGSSYAKAVLLDASGALAAGAVRRTGVDFAGVAEALREDLLRAVPDARGAAFGRTVATGYGRDNVPFATGRITEVTCLATACWHLYREALTAIDVGGQDTKVVRVGPGGEVADFTMNDKCAAGTGRFLEVILPRLGVPWDEVAMRYQTAPKPVSISSTCTVFAESEVISLLANGESVEGIVKGLHTALADRVAALAGRLLAGAPAVFLSGGVARNPAMVAALSAKLGREVSVVPDPQLVGALGAALSLPG